MDYSVDNFCAHIDVERTKDIYRSFVADSGDNSAVVNFRKNVFLRKERLEDYLSPLGIDISKYQGLDPVSVNWNCQERSIFSNVYVVCKVYDNFQYFRGD